MKTETELQSPADLVSGSSAQVLRGAELYELHCSACHGNSGLGLAEARLSFPEDHRNCEECHRSSNPAKAEDMGEMLELGRQCFSLGQPPDLRADTLMRFGNAGALYSYIKSAMPRWAPGNLPESEYIDITAFLLALNENLPPDADLTPQNAALVLLHQ